MIVWGVFIAFIILFLALDLGVFNRTPHVIKTKEAAIWTSVWVTIALGFSGIIYWLFNDGLIENPTNLALLGITLVLTAVTALTPKVTALHGAGHLAVFVLYILSVFI